MPSVAYLDFIEQKRRRDPDTGFAPEAIADALYPFQRDLTEWALRRGRSAIFADCGLGKTPIQLEWARQVCETVDGDVLIVAPLAVSSQTAREGVKFDIDVTPCREIEDVREGINITNYERLERFVGSRVGRDRSGRVLDPQGVRRQDARGVDPVGAAVPVPIVLHRYP